MKILITRDVEAPRRGTALSAGLDFFVPNDCFLGGCELMPGETIKIPSGIRAKIPQGKALIFFNKSGVASKKTLQVGACVVDEDYQGEIHLNVTNIGSVTQTISNGEKLVQGILLDVDYSIPEEVHSEEELFGGEVTERGEGGFGSTGTTVYINTQNINI